MSAEDEESDKVREFSLETWIDQLRFEVQTSSSFIVRLLYAGFLLFLFYQILASILIAGLIAFPQWAWPIMLGIFALAFTAIVYGAGAGREIAGDYKRLLGEIFMNKLEPESVAARYAQIQSEAHEKMKWWRGRKRG